MNIDGLKNIKINAQRTQMTFCASCKSCPAIDISTDSDKVIVGGEDEGYTEFTKDQFELFVKTKRNAHVELLQILMDTVMVLTLMFVVNHKI